ncbi:MAG: hypothetical protein ABI609_07465 [Acidobacteriota bacterium]
MPIAIDGSNLGGMLGGRGGARNATAVLAWLQPWARGRSDRMVLVFDGPPQTDLADRYGALEVRWSGRDSGDAVLLRVVSERPQDWQLLTNDRELARRCGDLGVRHLPLSSLVKRRRATPPSDKTRDAESPQAVDIKFWERWFRGEVE